jgi:DNA-binding response OmpR family regulator
VAKPASMRSPKNLVAFEGAPGVRLSIYLPHMRSIFTKKKMTNSNGEKKRILFVEDDEGAQELLTCMLSGYEVVVARDSTEGLRLARKRVFDLYILDNWLPDGTGIELCYRIRKFDQHTPILFYSAAAYAHDTQDALDAGAQEYLIKPVEPQDLRRTVARLVYTAGLKEVC